MLLFLCYVFPPLAVLLMGRPFSAVGNLFATLCGWMPGVRHALVCYADHKATKSTKQVVDAVNAPKWTYAQTVQSEDRLRRKGGPKPEVIYIDLNDVGQRGTVFRKK